MIKRICGCLIFLLALLEGESVMAFELMSPSFTQGGKIPSQFTCDGSNISPALIWKDLPKGTQSLVLIMDDPDAPVGTWDHWILYNIPPSTTTLSENLQTAPQGSEYGKNSWNQLGYGGPCPPDREHRYFFKLYALDTTLSSHSGLTKKEIEKKMIGHILATVELMGRYQRN